MITIENVNQGYKKKSVLKNINLHIEQNERCALIGKNGAGKSTLIYTMLNVLPLKEGSITLHDIPHNREGWKRYVSYLPEKFQLYPHLTGEENLRFFASAIDGSEDVERMERALKMVSLWDDRHRQVSQYSKGMHQRLGLSLMLYFDTEIFILDEPTSGLDPMGREAILQILDSLENKTILLSSHHMEEVKKICTHVAYLENGEITKYTIEEFTQKHLGKSMS